MIMTHLPNYEIWNLEKLVNFYIYRFQFTHKYFYKIIISRVYFMHESILS